MNRNFVNQPTTVWRADNFSSVPVPRPSTVELISRTLRSIAKKPEFRWFCRSLVSAGRSWATARNFRVPHVPAHAGKLM